ncbi:MAG: hypothetical protein FJX76_24920 [Armatimonadetes bacterium]|nr:hypothetical protein [Armatimonadota bacterium]
MHDRQTLLAILARFIEAVVMLVRSLLAAPPSAVEIPDDVCTLDRVVILLARRSGALQDMRLMSRTLGPFRAGFFTTETIAENETLQIKVLCEIDNVIAVDAVVQQIVARNGQTFGVLRMQPTAHQAVQILGFARQHKTVSASI